MKLGGWVVMLIAMMVFLTIMGYAPPGVGATLLKLNIVIDPLGVDAPKGDIQGSTFWLQLIGVFTALGVVGSVLIGLFGKGYDPSLVYAPALIFIAGMFMATFVNIIGIVAEQNQWWMTSITTIIFVALAGGFLMACFDYFGGR